jgi:predicted TIM-barrel fold metal-dependent hydrolase
MKQALKNIWYDTAASVYLYDAGIYAMARQAGVLDRVLFGTDFPLLTADRYYKDMDAAGLTPAEKEQILGINAQTLYPVC